jgi:YbbR domain-containing protein
LRDIPAGVKILSHRPTSFVIQLEEIIEQEVPVRPTLRGLPAPGFEIAHVHATPAKIAVAGPRSRFEDLPFIGTEVIDTQDISATKEVVAPVEVDPNKGFRLSREKVVKVKVVVRRSRGAGH